MCVYTTNQVSAGCVHLFLVRMLSLIILMVITNMLIIHKQLQLRQSSPQAEIQSQEIRFTLNNNPAPLYHYNPLYDLTDSCGEKREKLIE